AERAQREWRVEVLLDVAADLLDFAHLLGRALARLAAPAGAESGALRIFRPAEKRHVPAQRAARGARGPAVHAGGRDGVIEVAVMGSVLGQNGVPPGLLGLRDGGHQRLWKGGGIGCHAINIRLDARRSYPILAEV